MDGADPPSGLPARSHGGGERVWTHPPPPSSLRSPAFPIRSDPSMDVEAPNSPMSSSSGHSTPRGRRHRFQSLRLDGRISPQAALLCASAMGDHSILTMLDDGPLLRMTLNSSRDPTGWTPLHYAVYYGNASTAQFLLDRGADINAMDDAERTPVDFGLDELLSTASEDTNTKEDGEQTGGGVHLLPKHLWMHIFQILGSMDLFSLGRASGVCRLWREMCRDRTLWTYDVVPESCILRARERNLARLWLTYLGKNVKVERGTRTALTGFVRTSLPPTGHTTHSMTPKPPSSSSFLHLATRMSFLCVVRDLLRRGFPVDAPDSSGETCLCCACHRGDLPLVKTLLIAGASLHPLSTRETPLYLASQKGFHKVMRLLLLNGAMPDCGRLGRFQSPLHASSRRGDTEGARLLLCFGAIPHTRDCEGYTALDRARRDSVGAIQSVLGEFSPPPTPEIPQLGVHELPTSAHSPSA